MTNLSKETSEIQNYSCAGVKNLYAVSNIQITHNDGGGSCTPRSIYGEIVSPYESLFLYKDAAPLTTRMSDGH